MKLSILFAAAVATAVTANAQRAPTSPPPLAQPSASNLRGDGFEEGPATPPTAADSLMQSNNYGEGAIYKADSGSVWHGEHVNPATTKLTVAELATKNIPCTSDYYCVQFAIENTGSTAPGSYCRTSKMCHFDDQAHLDTEAAAAAAASGNAGSGSSEAQNIHPSEHPYWSPYDKQQQQYQQQQQ